MPVTPNMTATESRLRLIGGVMNLTLAAGLVWFGVSQEEPWFFVGAAVLAAVSGMMFFEWKTRW